MTLDRTAAVAAAIVLAAGLIVGGALVGRGVVNARTGERIVTVRGLAEQEVKSDLAILPLRFTETGDVLEDVQGKIDADTTAVKKFLADQGYRPEEMDLGRLQVTDTRANQQRDVPARFVVAQTVLVRTRDVDRVQSTTRALSVLVRQGVVLQDFNGPSYIFTRLNDVRPGMIQKATQSARSGAEQFAKDSGAALAGIRNATQGSFEIMPRDQTEGGDNSADASLVKHLRVVTTITYNLK